VSQPTTSRYARELQTAQRLAREAGAIAMTYFRGDDLAVERKKHDEPVTIADKEASQAIVSGLRAAFPDDVVISEENADDLRRLEVDRVWYVDPIDGTKDFIKGRDGFSVMIGMCDGLRPAVGVVYQPLGDRLFFAASDAGAWFIAPERPARELRVSDVSDAGQVRLVASASHRDAAIDQVKSALGIDNEFNIGSVGLKISLISLAERDLYVNPSSHSKTWDTCAPEAILEAAGGRMTDLYGDPLPYDVERMDRSRGMVASNGHVHDAVLERLAPLFPRP
jgi:3'(2'), 5'-bisphosphate nucleotidase